MLTREERLADAAAKRLAETERRAFVAREDAERRRAIADQKLRTLVPDLDCVTTIATFGRHLVARTEGREAPECYRALT